MAFAETAQLAVQLNLSGNLGAGVAKAEGQLGGLNKAASGIGSSTGRLSGALTTAEGAAGRFGGALGHAGGQLRSLAFGPLGLIGVTAGLFSFAGAIGTSLGKAQEFGKTVVRLTALTGLQTDTTSALSAAMEHFNIDADKQIRLVGFLEKNVGLLAARKDGIKNFQTEFGLALTDSTGKLKDANEQILTTADYFNNKSIPATTKAAALSKLYGRTWQEMVPFLAAGRKGILDAEQAAADFGLTLTKDNIGALTQARKVTRDWGDALGGLELQIGLQLLPSLTDLTKSATQFVSQNRGQIVGFFKEGAKWAGELGKAIKDYVIPAFGLIKSGWDTVPDDFKKFIIGGAILGKTSKFLFNVGPIDILKGVGGAFFSRGSPVNPMWVRQVGLPGGGGIPVSGGGLSGLAKVALVGEAVGLVVAVEAVREAVADRNSKIAGAIQDQTRQYLAQSPSKADLQNSLAAVDKGIRDIGSNPLNVLVQGDALDRLNQMRDDIKAQLYAIGQIPQAVSDAAAKAIATNPNAAEASKQFDAAQTNSFNDQSPAMLKAPLAQLHQDFLREISHLSKLPTASLAGRALALEQRILGSGEGVSRKIADLTGIQRSLAHTGDRTTRERISRDLQALKLRLAQTTTEAGRVTAAAIAHKKQMVSVNVDNTISVSTTVSARQVRTAEVVVQRYGTNRIGWT